MSFVAVLLSDSFIVDFFFFPFSETAVALLFIPRVLKRLSDVSGVALFYQHARHSDPCSSTLGVFQLMIFLPLFFSPLSFKKPSILILEFQNLHHFSYPFYCIFLLLYFLEIFSPSLSNY